MESLKNIVNKNYWLFPDKPLTFVRFIIIKDDGNTSFGLKLSTPVQQIIFDNAIHLIDEKLTFTVPMYVCDNKKNLFKVELPNEKDIIVENINSKILKVNIVKSICKKLYYVMIHISECSINDCCKLILFFTKFNLFLCNVSCLKCYEHQSGEVSSDIDSDKNADKSCDTICDARDDKTNDNHSDKCSYESDTRCDIQSERLHHKCNKCANELRNCFSQNAWKWHAASSV